MTSKLLCKLAGCSIDTLRNRVPAMMEKVQAEKRAGSVDKLLKYLKQTRMAQDFSKGVSAGSPRSLSESLGRRAAPLKPYGADLMSGLKGEAAGPGAGALHRLGSGARATGEYVSEHPEVVSTIGGAALGAGLSGDGSPIPGVVLGGALGSQVPRALRYLK